MSRSIRAKQGIVAVSAYTMESAINTYQDLDLALLAEVGDIATLQPRRETNENEMNNREEADRIDHLGDTSGFSLNFSKAQPQHIAFLLGYGLGNVVSTDAGIGRLHTITPISDDLEQARSNPSFTFAQQLGKVIVRERFASMFVNSVTVNLSKDSWCKASGEIIGTGKYEASVITEEISAPENSTTITLAANGVAGSTAAERLDAIHQVKAELTAGIWIEVEYTAVSSATPAEITIVAPGVGTDNVTFKVLYAPTEATWQTFPSRVSEPGLRISELKFVVGGTYDGTTIQGGRDISAEINSLEYRLNNNGTCEFVPGAGGDYASRYFRDGRNQTVALDREFRDYIIRNYMAENTYFAASALVEGREFDTGHKYGVQLIFPRLGVLKAPVSLNGKRLAEKGDLAVLEDPTYGSVIAKSKNLATTYAA